MPADIRSLRKYAKLLNERIALEDKLKKLVTALTDAEPGAITYFEKQGVEQLAIEGRTLYLRRQVHTSRNKNISAGQACDVLANKGLPEYVGESVNIQGLSAYVRELEEGGQTIHEIHNALDGAFNIIEKFSIGHRKR